VITQTLKLGRLLIVSVVLALLAGCSATPTVSRSGPSTADSKLVSARVVWVEAKDLPIKVIKSEKYSKPVINDDDKVEAQRTVSQLVSSFRSGAPVSIQAQLAAYKVNEGGDATIELTPVTSFVVLGKARTVHIKAAIRRSGSTAEIWSVTIRVTGETPDSDSVFLGKFVLALMNELKNAGWVG
jgi:hypothetical protein